MNKQEWKDIPGYEGRYQVSNHGRIRSLAHSYKTGKGYIRSVPDRYIGGNKTCKKGYKRVKLTHGVRFIHSLVAEVWVPNPDNKPQVNHKDGNKLNNHPENLEWVTNQENRNHAVEHHLHAFDTDCPHTKLSKKEVDSIRNLYENKEWSQGDLAWLFNVCQQTISCIVTNKTRTKFRA